jgi:hypothetical protein
MRRDYIDSSDLNLLRTLGLSGSGSGLRASDAERERAAEALRRHHADGRLTTDELDERTERAYAAKTHGDLDQLFGDLPRVRAPEEERRPQRLRGSRPILVPILVALVALAAVSSVHFLWLLWPLLIFFFLFRFALRGPGRHSRSWPESRRRY